MKTDYTIRRRTYRACDNPACASGKTETGECDYYGSTYWVDCTWCAGSGLIFTHKEWGARKNKNGTFSIITNKRQR